MEIKPKGGKEKIVFPLIIPEYHTTFISEVRILIFSLFLFTTFLDGVTIHAQE